MEVGVGDAMRDKARGMRKTQGGDRGLGEDGDGGGSFRYHKLVTTKHYEKEGPME